MVDARIHGVGLTDHLLGKAMAPMPLFDTSPLDLPRQRPESGLRGARWEW